jgi:hypothetical protein
LGFADCLGIVFDRNSGPRSRVAQREPIVKRSLISIISALVATALVVAAGAAFAAGGGGGGTKILGKGDDKLKPQCGPKPNDSCTAIGSGTVFTKQLGGKKNAMKAPSNGRIVAWAIELGHKPSNKPPGGNPDAKSNLEFFQDLFGNEKYGKGPVARLAILKRQGTGIKHKLVQQSPVVKLSGPFYNKDTVITLDQPLPIRKGEVVGLTSLTWIPTIRALGNGQGKASYRLSLPKSSDCKTDAQIGAKPQKKVGSTREYGCLYNKRRLFYKAWFVPN